MAAAKPEVVISHLVNYRIDISTPTQPFIKINSIKHMYNIYTYCKKMKIMFSKNVKLMSNLNKKHESTYKSVIRFQLHIRCRSTPGNARTLVCNMCSAATLDGFYCSCNLFVQYSCAALGERVMQGLTEHSDQRPCWTSDDVPFPVG